MSSKQRLQVITANNGYEAVTTFAKDPLAIDIVLTDVVMPEIGGHETSNDEPVNLSV